MVIGEKHNPYLTLYDTHRGDVAPALNSNNRETAALPYIRGLGVAPRCLCGLVLRCFGGLGIESYRVCTARWICAVGLLSGLLGSVMPPYGVIWGPLIRQRGGLFIGDGGT